MMRFRHYILCLSLSMLCTSLLSPADELAERMMKTVDLSGSGFLDCDWTIRKGSSMIFASGALKESKEEAVSIQILLRDDPEGTSKGYDERSNGYPARRISNRKVWVIIGRIEARVSIFNADLQSDTKLDEIIARLNPSQLESL